jgi:hypothetical protein
MTGNLNAVAMGFLIFAVCLAWVLALDWAAVSIITMCRDIWRRHGKR